MFELFEWAVAGEEQVGLSARDAITFVLIVSEISWAATLLAVMVFDTWEVIQMRFQRHIEVKGGGE